MRRFVCAWLAVALLGALVVGCTDNSRKSNEGQKQSGQQAKELPAPGVGGGQDKAKQGNNNANAN